MSFQPGTCYLCFTPHEYLFDCINLFLYWALQCCRSSVPLQVLQHALECSFWKDTGLPVPTFLGSSIQIQGENSTVTTFESMALTVGEKIWPLEGHLTMCGHRQEKRHWCSHLMGRSYGCCFVPTVHRDLFSFQQSIEQYLLSKVDSNMVEKTYPKWFISLPWDMCTSGTWSNTEGIGGTA